MGFNFDLEAAIDQIATLEAAISLPTPGITNAYGYGSNPIIIDDPTDLPAVVHVPMGPQYTTNPAQSGLVATRGAYQLSYQIRSIALLIEVVPKKYPDDENAVTGFWETIVEAFLSYTNRVTLTSATGAHTYNLSFPAQSYGVKEWPPAPIVPYKSYWGLEYIHTFIFIGG